MDDYHSCLSHLYSDLPYLFPQTSVKFAILLSMDRWSAYQKMAPETENMVALGNLAQCWGWEVVAEEEAHQVQSPRSCNLSVVVWFGKQAHCSSLAAIWVISASTPQIPSSWMQLMDLQTMLKRKGQAKHRLQPLRCQMATQSHVQAAVVLASIWVALKSFLLWNFFFFLFFSSSK